MAVRDVLLDLAPELAAQDPALVDRFIGYAAAEMIAETWGAFFERGNALLAAHMLTVRERKGQAQGAVQSERVGDLSVSYAASAAVSEALDSTSHGAEFLRLRRNVYAGASGL